MEITIPFRLLLYWKSIFNKHKNPPRIKISKEGGGVRSILFFLPEKKEDAKIAHYLIKTDNPLPNYNIGFVCNENSMSHYQNSINAKIISYNVNGIRAALKKGLDVWIDWSCLSSFAVSVIGHLLVCSSYI